MRILSLQVRLEGDVVLTRQRARQIASLFGFPLLDQTRIATAASEIARNAFQYAGGGTVEFLVDPSIPPSLLIRVRERGPGRENLQAILDGQSDPTTGMGLGILGARRLMDRLEVADAPGGGAEITLARSLPRRAAAPTPQDLARISSELARHAPQGLIDELQHQNQELIRTLQELRDRQSEITELHRRELEETNRGVVALYAELDDNAIALRRISELKSRFLSNMSHEFRSPLNTILSLSGFLLDRSDGDLTPEQEKQVGFIRKAADGLLGLVNDLLDLAKVEAGKAVVRPKSFEVTELFEALRGTIRPLLGAGPVTLEFDEPAADGTLRTDEVKVGQILRNFLSNAVKYTERGTIRVSATPGEDDTVIFAVSDTGIGIAPEDRERVFEEFGQIEGPLQRRIKGTGLGLPLSRKLAELLGGSVSVRSEPGVGSTFYAVIPRTYREPGSVEAEPTGPAASGAEGLVATILIIDDQEGDRRALKQLLAAVGPYQIIEAGDGGEGLRRARDARPNLIFLDMVMPDMTGPQVLDRLKADDATKAIPVIVNTSKTLDREEQGRIGAVAGILDKSAGNGPEALQLFRDALWKAGLGRPSSAAELEARDG